MIQHTVGIIMNFVTGRMGTNQHQLRSIVEIIKQGDIKVVPSETIMPDPILIGRDRNKLNKICELTRITKMNIGLDELLKNLDYIIYFDDKSPGDEQMLFAMR